MSYQYNQSSHPTFHSVVLKLKHIFKRCRHRKYSMQSSTSMSAHFSIPLVPPLDHNKQLDFKCSPSKALHKDRLSAKQYVGAAVKENKVSPTVSLLPQKTVNAKVVTTVQTLPPRSLMSKSKQSLPTSPYRRENKLKSTLSQDISCKTPPQVLLNNKFNMLSAEKENINQPGQLLEKGVDVKKHPMLHQEIIAEISGENIQFRLKMVDETTLFEPIVLSPQPFPSLIWPAPKTKQGESQNYGYF